MERALQKEMTRGTQALYAFCALLVIILGWQFYQYSESLSQLPPGAVDPHKRYVFIHTNGSPIPAAPAPADGAFLKQVSYEVQNGVPNSAMMTCVVRIKNTGNATATGIQVEVRPYKDSVKGDENVGGMGSDEPIAPTDPRALMSQWITFPDLAPGQSATENAVFVAQDGYNPGKNPNPQIIFQTAKPKP
jgi:hypothetical protein